MEFQFIDFFTSFLMHGGNAERFCAKNCEGDHCVESDSGEIKIGDNDNPEMKLAMASFIIV